MVNGEIVDAIWKAKQEAKKVRDGIDGLSTFEKMVAAAQLAAVTRLVEAVEAL